MSSTLKYVSVLILLGFTILFNIVLVDIRFGEINYLLGKIASRDRISNTFSIVAKYELIKRRMLFGEDQNSDYELEAKIQALTSGNQFENQRIPIEKKIYQIPIRLTLNTIRLLLGKSIINTKEDDKVLEVLEIAYFLERNRKYKEALNLYDEVLSTSSITPRLQAAILVHKAYCFSMISNYDKAKQIYEIVISNYPETDEGILSWKLLDFIQSMENERKKLEKTRLPKIEKARQFYLLMDFRNAIKNYSMFLENGKVRKDLTSEARYFKGRAHEELGENEDAMMEYRIVMKIDKTEKWAKQANRRMLMLGEFYNQHKQIAEEARRKLEAYQDKIFAESVDKYKGFLTRSSIKAELLSKVGVNDFVAIPNDSILKMIDQIGNMESSEETVTVMRSEQRNNKVLPKQSTISDSQMRELERKKLLVQNPYRKPEALKQVIDERKNELRYVYNKRLRAGIKISGKMVVKIRIRPDGGIENAEILQSNLGDQKFEHEIVQRIHNWKFKAVPDSLGELTVNYPFEFDGEM